MQTSFKKLLSFLIVCTLVSSLFVSLIPIGAAAAGVTISPDDAPYAGVYQVSSDKAVTVTGEIGSTAKLTAGGTKYLYLIQGANDLSVSNTSANLTFTALDNNGLDYFDQVSFGTQPVISSQEDKVATDLNKSLAPGEAYTFTYTPSQGKAGIVYPYLYFTDTAVNTIRVTSDTGFYADVFKPSGYQGTLCWADAERTDIELLYVRNGSNTITIENIGNNTAVLGNISIHSSGELATHETWGSQINVANLKTISVVVEAPSAPTQTPTPTPIVTATPTPTGGSTSSGEFTYDAPAAGIYKVTSDKAVTVVNETGSYADLTGDAVKYMYLIAGTNKLTTTDTTATVTFTKQAANGILYLDQVQVLEEPVVFSQEDAVLTNLNKTLAVGETYTFNYIPSKGLSGLVYPYVLFTDSNAGNTIRFSTDTGFYADLYPNGNNGITWCWADANMTDVEILYIREGVNTITVENLGPKATTISKINIHSAGELLANETWGPQVNIANLKLTDLGSAPVSTPKPSDDPSAVNPDVSDRVMKTVYEGESYTSGNVYQTTYEGVIVAKANSESTATYTVTAEEDTIYNLYMKGAAWKDVSYDISIDGTLYSYATSHFHSDRNTTFPYQEECVATFPLTKGEHTIGFTFYCDSFYFDSFTLEDTCTKQYQILYGISDMATSQGIYEALLASGDYIYLDVEADTADLACPEMAFWKMVGKHYDTPSELLALYESVLTEELADPTVRIRNASNVSVAELPEGNSTVMVNCSDIPANTSLVCAIYKEGRLTRLPQVAISNTTTVSFGLSDVEAGSDLKIFAITDMEEITPCTSSNIYMNFYVAPGGSASNAGTSPNAPLATIAQALSKAKSVSTGMTGDIVIHVASGVYYSSATLEIDPTVSGKNGYKIIIRGDDPDDRPVISGGEALTGKWTKVSGKNYWVASTTTTETRALYVNGYQAVLARSDDIYAGEYITPSSPKNAYHTTDGLKVSFSEFPAIPRDLAGESRLQLVFNIAWTNHRFPVSSVSYDSNYAYLKTTYPYYNAFVQSIHTSTIMPIAGRGFYLENAMALLDEPGEFYFDKTNRKIYYYPYEQEDMTTAETYCAVTDGLMTIKGSSTTSRVENLEFHNISFRYGAWDDATAYGAAYNQADELRRGTASGYSQMLMHAQIQLSYADSIVFDGCEFACLGSSAMYMTEGVTNSKVINSDFHDISGGGVSVSDYRHNSTYKGSGRCKNIEIGNNIFHRVAQEFMNLPAISVYYLDSAYIYHNDIKYLPYTGISIGWGWGYGDPTDCGNHIVSYNKVAEACRVLDDGAQIYTLSDQQNMHLTDNYLINPGNYRRGGVYFDEGTGYISMCDNVIEGADDSGDFWLFARQYVNLNDNYVAYNHTDGGNPKNFATFPLDTNGVTYGTNNINQTSWKMTAQRIMAEAGVEDKTRVADVDDYPSWRTLPMLHIPEAAIIE